MPEDIGSRVVFDQIFDLLKSHRAIIPTASRGHRFLLALRRGPRPPKTDDNDGPGSGDKGPPPCPPESVTFSLWDRCNPSHSIEVVFGTTGCEVSYRVPPGPTTSSFEEFASAHALVHGVARTWDDPHTGLMEGLVLVEKCIELSVSEAPTTARPVRITASPAPEARA